MVCWWLRFSRGFSLAAAGTKIKLLVCLCRRSCFATCCR